MASHKFNLYADYFQVYLMDDEANDDASEIWTEQALDLKLGIAKNTLAIGTFRNVDVDFEVEIVEKKPQLNLAEWDNVSQGYLTISSGKCAIFGCTDYLPDAARITLPSGDYAAFSMAKGLDTITEEWEDADDYYKVILWPSSTNEHKSIKRYENT